MILIVNGPELSPLPFAADRLEVKPSEFARVEEKIHSGHYRVIAMGFEKPEDTLALLKRLNHIAGDAQKLVSIHDFQHADLRGLYETADERVRVCDFTDKDFTTAAQEALARAQTVPAPKAPSSERPVQKRLVNTKNQVEALHKALAAVHSAQSVAEVESALQSALGKTLDLSWARVFLYDNEHLEAQLGRIRDQTLFKSTLQIGSRNLGRIVLARTHLKAFTKGEEEALNQISESVALALDRLAKLSQAETLKVQWDATFDAISEPLCLTDQNFNILRTNRAFLETTKLKLTQAIGTNCFSTFCGPSGAPAPVSAPKTSAAFTVQRTPNASQRAPKTRGKAEPHTYEVTTQKIQVGQAADAILLILFRDITEQKRIEKQIFESAKMAELGTIGSSIAHDINNPLGGVLSFLQLIKMDLAENDPLRDDVLEMEKAGQRCKEIVENLLRFSRRQETGVAEPLNLTEVVDHALKVSELQTRSLGVTVEFKTSRPDQIVVGHFNLLSQALSHILQNAFDAVSERLSQNPGYNGRVTIDLISDQEGLSLTIADNGVGISPELQNKILNPLFSTKTKNQGLGLTLAYQIVDEHGGRLEIFSRPNVGTTVKISFINV